MLGHYMMSQPYPCQHNYYHHHHLVHQIEVVMAYY
jgi:hypothetical protein